jgi:DNA invertase Pin-like site-specific DNA recombinase
MQSQMEGSQMAKQDKLRAVGLARKSSGSAESDSIAHQVERIKDASKREGFKLVAVHEEPDVSGGASLEHRHGLRQAVELVEAGKADVIVAAFFDRFFRGLKVQAEVLERIEKAGGQVLALDVGAVSNGSASLWLSSTMMGMVAEYHRRATRDRVRDAVQASIDAGVPPFANTTPAYRKREDGKLEPHPDHAALIAEAFRMRATETPLPAIQRWLREQGIEMKHSTLQALLARRIVRGELHFGTYTPNLKAHAAIIDEETWQKVQEVAVSRGRKAKVDRLLARMGILRCKTCGKPMSVVNQKLHKTGKRYANYRCGTPGDHPGTRAMIVADVAEEVIRDAVIEASRDVVGRASYDTEVAKAKHAAASADANLQAAFRAFAGAVDEPGAAARLGELRAERDALREKHAHLEALSGAATLTVTTVDDWDRLTLAEQRALVRNYVARAIVRPGGWGGKGGRAAIRKRVSVELRKTLG